MPTAPRQCSATAVLALLALACACTSESPVGGPLPLWEPAPQSFWDAPWPSDLRRDADGTIAMAGFPDPFGVDLVQAYLVRAENLNGFGTSSPIYLPFDGLLDPSRLPTPAESLGADSTVVLVDIDPTSAHWGERFPITLRQLTGESQYFRDLTLAVAPLYGFPLRPSTKYALLVTTGAAAPNPAFVETLTPGHPQHDPDLRQALWFVGLESDDVAIATTFTTYDPVAEMASIAHFLQHDVGVPDLSRKMLRPLRTFTDYTSWETTYPSPVFTHGERPFNNVGGAFIFTEEGHPVVASWDDMRMSVCAPRDLTAAPPEGFPVVIAQHGTGGDYLSHCNSEALFETAQRLGVEGLVSIGIDQPLHGPRADGGAVSDLTHFNFVNPDSGLTNFRQGAADAIYLAHALASRRWDLRTNDGQTISLDPTRVGFIGHSQGGLTGGIAAPFLGADVNAVVLSGAGAVLSITLVERKDILDFADLVETLLGFEDDEFLSTYHPANGLIQMLSEVTDTVNYAPYWHSQRGNWRGHVPANVLLTNGTLDANTPYQTAIALAAAGRLPVLEGAVTDVEALDLRGERALLLPATATTVGFDGQPVTAGFAQYWQGSHFVIYEEEHAAQLTTHFLRSASDGRPVFWTTPDVARPPRKE